MHPALLKHKQMWTDKEISPAKEETSKYRTGQLKFFSLKNILKYSTKLEQLLLCPRKCGSVWSLSQEASQSQTRSKKDPKYINPSLPTHLHSVLPRANILHFCSKARKLQTTSQICYSSLRKSQCSHILKITVTANLQPALCSCSGMSCQLQSQPNTHSKKQQDFHRGARMLITSQHQKAGQVISGGLVSHGMGHGGASKNWRWTWGCLKHSLRLLPDAAQSAIYSPLLKQVALEFKAHPQHLVEGGVLHLHSNQFRQGL